MKVEVQDLRKVIETIQTEKKRRGTFFTVTARTRKDQELRKFNCSFGYAKYKVGGQPAYDSIEKNLLVVWDQKAYQQFKKGEGRTPIRSINCNQIWNCRCCGVDLFVNGEPTREYFGYKNRKVV